MGERRLGKDVIREAVRELGHRVRGQRRDHEQVGAGEVRVEVFLGRPASERRERLTPDEAVRPARDERNHLVTRLHEQARQLAGLVRGDPAGDSQQNAAHADILPARARST